MLRFCLSSTKHINSFIILTGALPGFTAAWLECTNSDKYYYSTCPLPRDYHERRTHVSRVMCLIRSSGAAALLAPAVRATR